MDLKELVAGYAPDPAVSALLDNTRVVILCGVTGAGKDTVQNELFKKYHYERIITSTTREPREENGVMEQDGKEYYFYSLERAVQMVRDRQYFEVAVVHGTIYGVTAQEISRIHTSHSIAMTDVDYQGVDYFKQHAPSTLAIFIIPPSYDVTELL